MVTAGIYAATHLQSLMPTPTAGQTIRFTSPDPATNAALQGIQNNIAQLSQPVGPGAGTYVVGAALTVDGNQGTITLDAQGRVTAIQVAS